eukprot:3822434-Rhodomonas_salina.5
MQARELTDHLEDILEDHEVDVIPGQCRVEIRPRSINKGVAVELLLRAIEQKKPVDFVLCVGDDRCAPLLLSSLAWLGALFVPWCLARLSLSFCRRLVHWRRWLALGVRQTGEFDRQD